LIARPVHDQVERRTVLIPETVPHHMLHIDRCVCMDCSFEELKQLAAAKKLDLRGLSRATGCGMGCGLCKPYIKVMLASGKTVFTEMLTEADVTREVRDATRRSQRAPEGAV
jgi:bacterioferritin-associated ferredoxin